MQSDVPWIIAHFGFDSIQSYIDWLDLLDPDALHQHILDVIQLILGE